MKKVLIINGPNINILGKREGQVYGNFTYDELIKYTEDKLKDKKIDFEWFQSNSESEIVTKIQTLHSKEKDLLLINPAAYSHTSLAIYDALLSVSIPIVEVHLSNTHARESFRSSRFSAKAAHAILEGLGKDVYYLGILSKIDTL